MSGSERGGNSRRRSSRRREKDDEEAVAWQPPAGRQSPAGRQPVARGAAKPNQRPAPGKKKQEKAGYAPLFKREPAKSDGTPRLKWTPVKPPSTPLPVLDCPLCEKPIKDIAAALSDRNTGVPVHFDCILEKITAAEEQESGDVISYIGGGRFAVLHYQNPQDLRSFKIKKIIEWEDKENRADWRKPIADRYSIT
jgi:hypothetical protein